MSVAHYAGKRRTRKRSREIKESVDGCLRVVTAHGDVGAARCGHGAVCRNGDGAGDFAVAGDDTEL